MIRKAVVKEIGEIHKMLNHYADQGLLLPRSLSDLYSHLRDFFVIEDSNKKDSILAVCALSVCWDDLAEIRSLAVAKEFQGKDYGTQLIQACLEEARSLGLRRIFTLTYVPEFFIKMGFREVEKSLLPHKVWADCLDCPKFPDCDETALIKEM